jgi:hypothetical protein
MDLPFIAELNRVDLMRARVTDYADPATTAERVIPQLVMLTGRIISNICGLKEFTRCTGRISCWAAAFCISEIRELSQVSLTAKRTSNTHRYSVLDD